MTKNELKEKYIEIRKKHFNSLINKMNELVNKEPKITTEELIVSLITESMNVNSIITLELLSNVLELDE